MLSLAKHELIYNCLLPFDPLRVTTWSESKRF